MNSTQSFYHHSLVGFLPHAWLPASHVSALKSMSVRVTVNGASTVSGSICAPGLPPLLALLTLQEFRGRIDFLKRCNKREKTGERKSRCQRLSLLETEAFREGETLTSFSVPVSLLMATMAQMRICKQLTVAMHTPNALPHRGYT